ncbi:MBL fold metallo-hydrolase [Modicisalibacter luteus]|uniref:MBL fold metallo-hydrolase n=1 Tax=Modicisalibacter luteus TaxID=453962 RepID=UPI0036439CE7
MGRAGLCSSSGNAISNWREALPLPRQQSRGWSCRQAVGLLPQYTSGSAPAYPPLPEDGSVPGMPSWHWVATPGHTQGHVSFFRDTDRAMIVGDAFVTVRQDELYQVLTQHQELNGPPRYFTPDWNAARDSVQRLADLKPSVAMTGHGLPMSGEALEHDLESLARDFDSMARPAYGKSVE